jgi:hypothetical protein
MMQFFYNNKQSFNPFSKKSGSNSSDDQSTASASSSISSFTHHRSQKESYPDWNNAKTILYGSTAHTPTTNRHQNQGYFSKKTQVADDKMYKM